MHINQTFITNHIVVENKLTLFLITFLGKQTVISAKTTLTRNLGIVGADAETTFRPSKQSEIGLPTEVSEMGIERDDSGIDIFDELNMFRASSFSEFS